MNSTSLHRIGSLKPHAVRKGEIERMYAAADRALEGAESPSVAADARFGLACQAILLAATAAMLASGNRPIASEPGYHQLLIRALTRTAGVEPRRVQVLEAFRLARIRADYFGESVSDAVAAESVEEARDLLAQVRAWIDENRASA